jgi:hypothetical protein
MAQSMRDYFLAGLALEEASEKRDRARAALREAAKVYCLNELNALDAASDAVMKAEARLVDVMQAAMKGQAGQMAEASRQWAEQHAATCDNPDCEIKKSVQRAGSGGLSGKLN